MGWERILQSVMAASIFLLAITQIPVAMNALKFNQCYSFVDKTSALKFCMGDPEYITRP
tara:strand:+ start:374 stop:550 length:177 start_codon:yes stop_codon:yes gene_type:complete